MDPIIFTSRLKLILITKAERGSPELEWLHKLCSDEKATFWSINGRAKSIEDTEKVMKGTLPTNEREDKTYRAPYAVHKVLEPTSGSITGEPRPGEQEEKPTEFIGLVNLKSVDAVGDASRALAIPEHLTLPAAAATTTLTIEVGYSFLPATWGKGYATEAVDAALEACKRARSFWTPFSKLYVRAIVNADNPASLRVMEKVGVTKKGVYEWTGKAIFHGGEWRDRNSLHIYGMYLLE